MHTRCRGLCIDFWACALTNRHGSGIFHRWIIILTFWSASKSCLFVFWTDFLCWSVFEQLRNGSINLRLYLSIYLSTFLRQNVRRIWGACIYDLFSKLQKHLRKGKIGFKTFSRPQSHTNTVFYVGSQGFLYNFFVAWQSAGAWQI